MNLFTIIEAVCDAIKARFPASPIYIMRTPQGFKRPSFFVNLVGFTDQDLCKQGLRRQALLEIVFFAAQDAKGIVDTVQQMTAYQTLLQIFQGQSLPVGDRFLKITRIDGSARDSEVYLTLTLDYAFTPQAFSDNPEAATELMRQLFTKYQ